MHLYNSTRVSDASKPNSTFCFLFVSSHLLHKSTANNAPSPETCTNPTTFQSIKACMTAPLPKSSSNNLFAFQFPQIPRSVRPH